MPPQSRGNVSGPSPYHSKSTPNLPTLRNLQPPSPPPPPPLREHRPSDPWLPSDDSSSDSDGPPTRPPLSRSSTTYLGPAAFAPPFYNRPPTPLPPSPSLTSLLRPIIPSRPTSPDHSSDDGTRSTAGAASTLSTSFRTARPVARASPKVPTYEYYGFTLYLASSAAFMGYILWSFLPSPFLHQLGIYYYPNRWWALAGPAWLVMLVVWIYVALAGWNTERETLGLGDVRTVVDEAANVAVVDSTGRIHRGRGLPDGRWKGRWRGVWDEGTDAVMDIPVGGVCEVLYGEGREEVDF